MPKTSCILIPRKTDRRGFSLVEVAIALGLVSYALIALLGLLTVALSSSRESSLETALSQIALHAASVYDGTASQQNLAYSYEGIAVNGTNASKYFEVAMVGRPSDAGTIANTSTNLHLLTLSISSPQNPGVTNVIQTSAFVP